MRAFCSYMLYFITLFSPSYPCHILRHEMIYMYMYVLNNPPIIGRDGLEYKRLKMNERRYMYIDITYLLTYMYFLHNPMRTGMAYWCLATCICKIHFVGREDTHAGSWCITRYMPVIQCWNVLSIASTCRNRETRKWCSISTCI